ncbi:hypothetical protein NH340_JMT06496 [Sarcoptes scabiei]|nr:hypothetical protein NH340_JMT06496 [Sarcoptes scabiei]
MNAIDSSNQLIPLSFESFSAKIISNKHHFVFEAFEHDSRKLKRSIIERKRSFQMKLPSESDAIESILECERKLFFHTNTKVRLSKTQPNLKASTLSLSLVISHCLN